MVATRDAERAARLRAAEEHNATTGILALPSDLLRSIFSLIPLAPTLLNAAHVCKAFRYAAAAVLRNHPFPWQADKRVRTGRKADVMTLAGNGTILVGEKYCCVSEYSHDLVRIRGTDDLPGFDRDTYRNAPIIAIASIGNGSWYIEADAQDNLETWQDPTRCSSSGDCDDVKCLVRLDDHRVVVGRANVFFIITYEFGYSDRYEEVAPVDADYGPEVAIGDDGDDDGDEFRNSEITEIATTPDGTHIVTGDYCGRVKAWNADTLECVGANKLLWQGVAAMAAMPDSKRFLASSGHDHIRRHGTVELFAVENCARLRVFRDLQPMISTALLALPDKRHALSAEEEIKLFDVETGEVLRTFPAVPDHPDDCGAFAEKTVYAMVLLPDTLRFVAVTWHGVLSTYAHGLRPVA